MTRLLKILLVVVFLGSVGAGIAVAQFDYTPFHWWTDHGWMLTYECGIWSEPWTVTAGANPNIIAVLSKPRKDGRMDFCFVSLQPDPNWPVKP